MNNRKWITLLCCMILSVMIAVPAQAKVTVAQKVLAKEGTDAFWELVNTHYSTSMFYPADTAMLTIWEQDGPAMGTQENDEYHPQTIYRVCMQETAGVGFTIEQIDLYYSEPWGNIQLYQDEGIAGDLPVHVEPYGSFSYGSGGPTIGNLRYEIVAVSGTDDNGHELEFYGVMQRLNAMPEGAAGGNDQYDVGNLRYDADYEVEVAKDVWWVPCVSLGESRYTNYQIAEMVSMTPEEKQENISTLYEALQLYTISNFATADDNVRIEENGIDWEHHKPGYDAIRTNEGCCATDSNWLNYILKDDYEEIGFIAYSQPDGSGHVFNYIRKDGYYYFVDLTHYRTDFLDGGAPETGMKGDYNRSDFVAGNLHKAVSPEAYIKYCVDSYNEKPARFFMYQADNCLPVTGMPIDGAMTIVYPEGTDITVLDGYQANTLNVVFVAPPVQTNNWAALPDAELRVDEKYLATGDAAEPLTAWKEGDLLTLEDYGQNAGFATIDGVDYSTAQKMDAEFGFEPNFSLYGGCFYSYHDYELPTSEMEPILKPLDEMDSVVAGDMSASILKKYERTQIVLCEEKDGQLEITRVMNNGHYFMMPVNLYRDDNGQWIMPPTYWILMIYENENGIQYEFGRFRLRQN